MKSVLQKQFGRNFKQIRKRKRLSQEAVAERSGMTASYISEVESRNANPTLLTVGKLAIALEVDMPALFYFDQISASPQQIRIRIKSIVDETDDNALATDSRFPVSIRRPRPAGTFP